MLGGQRNLVETSFTVCRIRAFDLVQYSLSTRLAVCFVLNAAVRYAEMVRLPY